MNNVLYHHGVLGMKWGIRRYQNPDGSLTREGKKKYSKQFDQKLRNNWVNSYNESNKVTNKEIARINEKYSKVNIDNPDFKTVEYLEEINNAFQRAYGDQLKKDFGRHPVTRGYEYVERAPMMNMYIEEIKWARGRARENYIRGFINNTDPRSLARTIDDYDLLEAEIDNPKFRTEYGITDEAYNRWKHDFR